MIKQAILNKWPLFLVVLFTGVVLFSSVNRDLPFEQDQGSKAAKIIYMVKDNSILKPASGVWFYRDNQFTLYYMISALVYKVFGGNIFGVMNSLSCFMGILFFAFLSEFLRKVLNIHPLVSWIVFFSMPGLTTTFMYGNEVAFSLTFFAISLFIMAIGRTIWNRALAGFFCSAAMYCRPDILLLLPFWLGWLAYIERDLIKDRRKFFTTLVEAIGSLGIFSVLFFFLFVRNLHLGSLSFEFNTNIKLLLAYLTYPFNLTIVIIGLIGWVVLLYKKSKMLLIISCSLLPLAFYGSNLSSPKYIIWMAFFYGIPAILLISVLKIRGKLVSFLGIAIWYFVSISPYGIFPFQKGAEVFLPTADGPLPTGSYIGFYKYNQEGFYSTKYESEIESADQAIQYISQNPDQEIDLIGRFNDHFFYSELASSQMYGSITKWRALLFMDDFPVSRDSHHLMVQRAYLSLNNMSEQVKTIFGAYLKNGQVRELMMDGDEETPFPKVIEVGNVVPQNKNSSLSARILFAYDYYEGEGFIHSSISSDLYRPTYWVKADQVISPDIAPIYSDPEWECYSQEIPGSQIWISEIPTLYFEENDPNQ